MKQRFILIALLIVAANIATWPVRASWNRLATWDPKADAVYSFFDFHEALATSYIIHQPDGGFGYAGYGITLAGRIHHYNQFSTFTDKDFYVYAQAQP